MREHGTMEGRGEPGCSAGRRSGQLSAHRIGHCAVVSAVTATAGGQVRRFAGLEGCGERTQAKQKHQQQCQCTSHASLILQQASMNEQAAYLERCGTERRSGIIVLLQVS